MMGFLRAKNNDATNPTANPFNPLWAVLITNLLSLRSASKICSVVYGKMSFDTPRRKLLIYCFCYDNKEWYEINFNQSIIIINPLNINIIIDSFNIFSISEHNLIIKIKIIHKKLKLVIISIYKVSVNKVQTYLIEKIKYKT